MTSAARTDSRAGCRRSLRAGTKAKAGREPLRAHLGAQPLASRPRVAAGAGLSAAGGGAWRAAGQALSFPDWAWDDQEAVSWRDSTGRHWVVEKEGVAL